MPEIEIVQRPANLPQTDSLGEGPFWALGEQALYWVDIASRHLFRYAPFSHDMDMWRFPVPVAAGFPARRGGLVVALQDGLYRFDPGAPSLAPLAHPDPDANNRANEVRCDPQGRILFGTMHNNIGPAGEPTGVPRRSGGLWAVDEAGVSTQLLADIGIANTLCWSPDGTRLYFADTLKNLIWSFAYDPEGPILSDRKVFVEGGPGNPDGSAMDEEGFLWTARWGAGRVIRYAPDGRVDRELMLPVTQPSSCAFGGPGRNTLFITSARFEMDDPGELDGALLAVEVDVAGMKMTGFAG